MSPAPKPAADAGRCRCGHGLNDHVGEQQWNDGECSICDCPRFSWPAPAPPVPSPEPVPASALTPRRRMQSYYFGFDATGEAAIDGVLQAVRDAGKSYHHTRDWNDDSENSDTEQVRIQRAADFGAGQIARLRAALAEKERECERLRGERKSVQGAIIDAGVTFDTDEDQGLAVRAISMRADAAEAALTAYISRPHGLHLVEAITARRAAEKEREEQQEAKEAAYAETYRLLKIIEEAPHVQCHMQSDICEWPEGGGPIGHDEADGHVEGGCPGCSCFKSKAALAPAHEQREKP